MPSTAPTTIHARLSRLRRRQCHRFPSSFPTSLKWPAPQHTRVGAAHAFEVADLDTLAAAKPISKRRVSRCCGPTFHGIFRSIYFFDPNGHRLELACNIGTPEQYAELERVAPLMLEEWSRTRKAPKHAQWLHVDPGSLAE